MQPLPRISVIIVNYNSSKDILALMPTLMHCGYSNFEFIVVDNDSPNDTNLERLLAEYPTINFIKSATNLGFAGANNLGIKAAKGDYLLFLNPDIEVTPGFIDSMLFAFKVNPNIGLVSPKIKYYHQPDTIQYAGCSKLSLFTMRSFSPGKGKKDGPLYSVSKPTSYGHGAAMMLSREAIEKVGPMSERYFLYYEEIDWCQRLLKHGFEIYYIATSEVYHKESTSVQKQSPLKIYYLSRNRFLFAKIHCQNWQLMVYFFYNLLVLMPKSILKYISKPVLLKAYLSGLASNLYTD
jgi:hypothetical protein